MADIVYRITQHDTHYLTVH